MSSLRDQLLKAGLVDRKKARQVARELKRERKRKQAQREKKAIIEARKAEERRRRLEEEIRRRREERARRERERAEAERRRLVDNLVRAYRLPERRGPVPFFHLTPDRRHCHRMWLPESWAWDLRRGALAIGWWGADPEDPDYVVLPAAAARRILHHDPDRILFLNDAPPPADDPAELPYGCED